MPIFKIEPISTTTVGGYPATITGIDASSSDFIVGTINAPAKTFDAFWDGSGYCRDNDHSCNLDIESNEFIQTKKAASIFGK